MTHLNTNSCFAKATFEFREVDAGLMKAKHARIMKIFAEALCRQAAERAEVAGSGKHSDQSGGRI